MTTRCRRPDGWSAITSRGVLRIAAALTLPLLLVPVLVGVAGTAAGAAQQWGPVTEFAGSDPGMVIRAVSCVDPTDCVAVGNNGDTAAYDQESGGSWGPVTDVPIGGYGTFTGVSCTSLSFCVAVGGGNAGTPIALEEIFGVWQPVQVFPTPNGSDIGELTSVSCTAYTICVITGEYNATIAAPPLQIPGGLFVVSTAGVIGVGAPPDVGSAWNLAFTEVGPLGNNAGPAPSLDAVSCATSGGVCMAVGNADDGATIALYDPPIGWFPLTAVPTPGGSGGFSGVSCTTELCQAVGIDGNGNPFVDSLSLSTFTSTEVEVGTGGSGLTSVSCVDASDCTAVGQDAAGQPMFATETAGQWGPLSELPSTSGSGTLTSVSCSDLTDCTAVGGDGSGYPVYAIESETGTFDTPTVSIAQGASAEAGNAVYDVNVAGVTGGQLPSGSVTVSDNGSNSCTIALVDGAGTCSLDESQGPWTVTARYGGDGNYSAGSATIADTVKYAPTLQKVKLAPARIGYNTVSVVARGAAGQVPSGSVTFADDESPPSSCSAVLSGSGKASCRLFQLASSSGWTVTATYAGNDNFGPATTLWNEDVARVPLTMRIRQPGRATTGPITFAVVPTPRDGIYPSGTMTVSDGDGHTCDYSVSVGDDSCAIAEVPGTYTVVARYGGDANYKATTTSTTVTVEKGTAAIGGTADPDPASAPGPVTYSVDMSGAGPPPAGAVTVSDGAGGTCLITVDARGHGSCTISEAEGAYEVTFSFGSDRNYRHATQLVQETVA